MDTPVNSFRTPTENDNEWALRKQFLENNFHKFPESRLICLSMCYINHVSYGVTYSPGVMAQLKELSQGLPLHLDMLKEKNNIAFVKEEKEIVSKKKKKENCLTYEKIVQSLNTQSKNNSNIKNLGKYTNFVHSSEASFQPTWPNTGAGSTGSTNDSKPCLSTNTSKYPGFGSANNSNPCISMNTSNYPGFGSAGSTNNLNPGYSMNTSKYPGFGSFGSTNDSNSGFSSNTSQYPGFGSAGSTNDSNSGFSSNTSQYPGFGSAGSTNDSNSGFSTNTSQYPGFGSAGSTNKSGFSPIKYPGFESAGSTGDSKPCFSPNMKPSTNTAKYPGFVNSGSAASDNSKPCFSAPTDTVSDMLMCSGFMKSEPKISPAEKLNASSNNNNNNKYLKLINPNPNLNVGNQSKVPSPQYRSKPVLKTPQETPKSDISPPAKKTLLTTPTEAAATTTTDSMCSSKDLGTIEVTYLEKNFYTLSESLRTMKAPSGPTNTVQMMNMALSKLKMFPTTDIKPVFLKSARIFVCRIRIANVVVGDGTGSNKKTAKQEAFTKAFNLITKPTLKIEQKNGQQVLVGNDQPRPALSKIVVAKSSGTAMTVSTRKSWGHFLIMENKVVNNPITVLRRSADINKMNVKYEFWPDPKGMTCQINLNDEPIMECVAETRSMAKIAVSERALLWLKQRCWTIVVKQAADSDNIDVTRDEIMGEIEKQFKPIPSDNVGNQLLRKMGWKGGGIGAEGNKGIEDPITVNQVIDRQGLGCHSSTGVSTKFNTYVREILLKYVKSKKQKDLVFTAEFSKEERAIIHQEARRYNLKSNSRGNGDNRHLIISRKRSAGQLFNHILASGGETQKYELIPPLDKTL